MKREELVEILEKAKGEDVILRGNFGDTYVNIGDVQELSDGKILLQTAPDPIRTDEIETFANLEDLVLEIKQFVGTEPETYNGVGIGIEKIENEKYIYVETEESDGTFAMISLNADTAEWLSGKLVEYANDLRKKTKKK